jgi:hypothetical protein
MPPQAAQAMPPLTDERRPAREPLPRPKVMRRPAQFSTPAPTPVTAAPAASQAPVIAPHEDMRITPPEPVLALPVVATAARSWQDDARFGLVLAATLLFVNAALMLWLPHLKQTHIPAPTAVVAVTPAAPAARAEAGVTVYSNPAIPEPTPYMAEEVAVDAPTADWETVEPYHILGSATDSGPNQ